MPMYGVMSRFQVDYTQGTKKSKQFNASLAKPIFSQTLSDEQDTPLLATVTSSIFQVGSLSKISKGNKSGLKTQFKMLFFKRVFLNSNANIVVSTPWDYRGCLRAYPPAVRRPAGEASLISPSSQRHR